MVEHFWKAKLIRGGPFVGVKTFHGPPLVDGEFLDRSHRWQAIVRLETSARMILMGDETPIEVEGKHLRGIERIDEAAYRHLIEHADWATKYRPDLPDANPETPVDWAKTTLPF